MTVLTTTTFTISEGPRVLAILEMLFHLLRDMFWIKAHLLKEAINHVLPSVSSAVSVVLMSMAVVLMSMAVVLMSMAVVFSLLLLSSS